jgi:hypothetical protein
MRTLAADLTFNRPLLYFRCEERGEQPDVSDIQTPLPQRKLVLVNKGSSPRSRRPQHRAVNYPEDNHSWRCDTVNDQIERAAIGNSRVSGKRPNLPRNVTSPSPSTALKYADQPRRQRWGVRLRSMRRGRKASWVRADDPLKRSHNRRMIQRLALAQGLLALLHRSEELPFAGDVGPQRFRHQP